MMTRTKSKIAAIALGVAALGLFAAACGSSDNSSKDTSTPTGSATNAASPSASVSGKSTATTEATSGAVGSAIDDLQKSSDNFVKANYDITYSIQTTTDGKPVTGTLVVKHKDNKDYLGLDGDLSGEGQSSSIVLIDDGTNSYICGASSDKSCLKTASDSAAGGIGQAFTALKPDKLLDAIGSEKNAKVESTSGRKVAGRDAKCYNVTSSDGNGTICFDKQTDLMLLIDVSGGADGAARFEATKVSGSPSDNDFKPPYPVQDLGAS